MLASRSCPCPWLQDPCLHLQGQKQRIRSFLCCFLLIHCSAFLPSLLSTHVIRWSPPRSSAVVSPAQGLHTDSRLQSPLIFLFVYKHDWNCFLNLIFTYFIERYRHEIDLYALISYPRTSQTHFSSSRFVFADSLGLSTEGIISSLNKDSFTSLCQIWMHLIT